MKTEKKYTLLDAQILGGPRDIADDVFDALNYFECDPKANENSDAYDKAMLWVAEGVEVVSACRDVIVCKITQFIEDNRAIFDTFLNLVWKTEYQPQNNPRINANEEEFYDVYIAAFFDFINGNFSTEDYIVFNKLINQPKDAPVGYVIRETQTRLSDGSVEVFYYGTDGFVYCFQDSPKPYKTKQGALKRIERETKDFDCVEQADGSFIMGNTWSRVFEVLVVDTRNQ